MNSPLTFGQSLVLAQVFLLLLSFHPFSPTVYILLSSVSPSLHSPVVVDVSGCHRVAKVRPHLEHITNKTQLVCNHTTRCVDPVFLSFSFFSFVLYQQSQKLSSSISQSHNPLGSPLLPFMALSVS